MSISARLLRNRHQNVVLCAQRLKHQERSVSGGVMLDKPKSMCFQDGGGPLVVTVDDIGANWKSKPQDNYKVSKVNNIVRRLLLNGENKNPGPSAGNPVRHLVEL